MQMKKLKYFNPTRQGMIISAAVGIATNNIAVGVILFLMFSLVSSLHISSK